MNKLDKLITMTDKEIQNWLRKISTETEITVLPIALLGVNDNVKECIFRNLSIHAKNSINKSIQEQSKNNLRETEIMMNINILENLL